MCYASLWIQAPADGFDPVHVFWMAENKYVNMHLETIPCGWKFFWAFSCKYVFWKEGGGRQYILLVLNEVIIEQMV